MKKLGYLLASLLGAAFIFGCGDGGAHQLEKKNDEELRGNFNRPLNQNELSQMGGGGKDANVGKPAAPPEKSAK